jgi:hypothetical protein
MTHGRVFHASEAPLADAAGNLPFGGKVQLGGPLDRLHHVEVTMMQMASALDTIIEHIQEKDPTAKNLFHDEDSETSTIIENPPPNMQSAQIINVDSDEKSESNDVPMEMKEHSGTKRQYAADSPLKH